MSQGLETPTESNVDLPTEAFVERRNYAVQHRSPICERRQFANSHEELSPDAAELGQAVDEYKLHHRRRFITHEETLRIIKSLGYHK
ncbi:MAG: hypothetical protein A2V70_05640 [Planctomycetes bacterium RBG_13_63_9]|nr:MAG: hypothetical protein A2V70_05640 [Planctomycetes bacterium RBG_13_63_9]